MPSPRTLPLLAFFSLLAGGMAIGFAGILMRLSDVNPIASAFWRMALAAPLLWLWAWRSRDGDAAAGKRLDFSLGLLLSGLYFAGDMSMWHLSLHMTTVANATLLSNFAPIFIAVWLWLAYRLRFSRLFLAGMGLATAGAILLVGGTADPADGNGGGHLLGDALGLGSAVFYAAYQLVIKQSRETYSTARLMAWSTTITGAALLPLAWASSGNLLPASAIGWLPLLGLALVAQIGGQTVIAYALAHLPAALGSVSLLIQPLTAAIAAWLIFGEAVMPLQMAGGALLLCGIWLAKRGS
ncbi:EamA-like transporter family protein [Noviherbaspirillum humi]|uniref:EamA-like transporter family protein n=1 Tax=Noviherbaspirillum humi TaxID=1688639 RepID=A0A239CF44_9BURK|nr:DMT family transporter [Noviherbaspirillum humi]SNS17963.1 EamA-like transporter family protein [Noviherbaspirillum humi]